MSSQNLKGDHPSRDQSRVCPWWLCFTFDNIFRRWLQNPDRILGPYIKPGQTVLDVGPGMGYFTIPLARLVGDSGKVIAADIQKKMLDSLYIRAERAGVHDRIRLHLSVPDKIGIEEPVDFCLAFWMVHEVVDQSLFLGEIAAGLKPNGLFLLAEPRIHVSWKSFNETLKTIKNLGLTVVDQPRIFLSNAVLFKK
jgi:ubiquinone/menaquinone biosynthesis C-methylase UbiE